MATKWKTKDGRTINIKDMSDSHLLNTIKYLERNAYALKNKAESSLWNVLNFITGEMAEMELEGEIDAIAMMEPIDYVKETTPYETMIWHAKRRKIL